MKCHFSLGDGSDVLASERHDRQWLFQRDRGKVKLIGELMADEILLISDQSELEWGEQNA